MDDDPDVRQMMATSLKEDEFARNTAGQESDREIGCRALDDIRIREGLGRKPDLVTPLGELVESGEVR